MTTREREREKERNKSISHSESGRHAPAAAHGDRVALGTVDGQYQRHHWWQGHRRRQSPRRLSARPSGHPAVWIVGISSARATAF